jgi:microcystin-dependent protein
VSGPVRNKALNMGLKPVTGLADGEDPQDAVNKSQLDAAMAVSMPSGGIIMWSGSVAAIPDGWFLCDGSNGTPDLRDRFIIGARQDDTGVAKTNVTGSLTQSGGSKDAILVSHNHTATSVVTDPGHTHNVTVLGTLGGTTAGLMDRDDNTARATTSATTGITVATTISTEGSSGTDANLPPYYALAFIMRA